MNRLLIEEGAILDPLNSTSGWTASAGTLTVESPPDGSTPCLCITSNVGADCDARRADPNYSIPDGWHLAFEVYASVPAYYADGNIRHAGFNMDDGIFNHHQWNTLTIHPNDWHTFLVPWQTTRGGSTGAGCSYPGTGNRHQTFNQLWLRTRATGGLQTKTWVRNMRLVKTRPRVCITIDDSHASQVDMVAVLNQLGLKAGFAVITGSIGTGNSLSLTQLDAIVEAGHELYVHTESHVQNVLNSATVEMSRIQDEVGGSREQLDAWYGKRRSHQIIIHPYGERGYRYDMGALQAGMILGVGTVDGVNAPFLTPSDPTAPRQTYPYISRHLVYRSANTHANNVGWLDHGQATGGMICLGYHYMSSGAYSGQTSDLYITPERWNQMLTELWRKNDVAPVCLLTEWLDDIGYLAAL